MAADQPAPPLPPGAGPVLVISAHSYQLDRRIADGINTLQASGRPVTLVSVPTALPHPPLHPEVRVYLPPADPAAAQRPGLLRRLRRALPRRVKAPYWRLRQYASMALPQGLLQDPDAMNVAFFLANSPAEEFAAIHCHDLECLHSALALRQAFSPRAKVIYDSHEYGPQQIPSRVYQRYWSRLEHRYIGQADLVITINRSLARIMAETYGLDRVEVIYNSCSPAPAGQRLDRRAFLEHFGAADGGFWVVTHGSEIKEKNLANLMLAFGRLDPDIRLFMLVPPEVMGPAQRLCRAKGIGNVHLGPWVAQERVVDFLGQGDLGIIPLWGAQTLNHLNCSPNKLFEYIEARVPISASDLPELRRIIIGAGIGSVYPMRDAASIAAAVADCAAQVRAGRFSRENLEAAAERYSWERQGQRLLGMYQDLGV